jgi:hypothetical protein
MKTVERERERENKRPEKKRRKDRGGLFKGCQAASHQHHQQRRLHARYAIFTITILITFLLSTHT